MRLCYLDTRYLFFALLDDFCTCSLLSWENPLLFTTNMIGYTSAIVVFSFYLGNIVNNDIIRQSLAAIKVPPHLEPPGLTCSDGKRLDGAIIIPWGNGCILVWDAMIVDFLRPMPP